MERSEELVHLHARLTAHEDAIVLTLSHLLSQDSESSTTAFLLGYCRNARQASTDDPNAADDPDYVRLQTELIEITKQIADRIDRGSRKLRDLRAAAKV